MNRFKIIILITSILLIFSVFAKASTEQSIVRIYGKETMGSGVIVNENGYILTCAHVIDGNDIVVGIPQYVGGKDNYVTDWAIQVEVDAYVVKKWNDIDIAVLKLKHSARNKVSSDRGEIDFDFSSLGKSDLYNPLEKVKKYISKSSLSVTYQVSILETNTLRILN